MENENNKKNKNSFKEAIKETWIDMPRRFQGFILGMLVAVAVYAGENLFNLTEVKVINDIIGILYIGLILIVIIKYINPYVMKK